MDKERKKVKAILGKLLDGDTVGSDIKKLKGRDDIFRVRAGDLRIIYRTESKENIMILSIYRRNESSYKE